MNILRFIITIISIAMVVCSCKKDTTTSEKCTQQCYNGGNVNVNCNCDCPSGYTGSQCQTRVCYVNHTATVSFINHSVNGYTYTIYWDDVPLTSVAAGKTITYPTAANVQRSIYAKANGTNIKSSVQILTFQECSVNNLTWSF